MPPSVAEDVFIEDVTSASVCNPTERLAERLKRSTSPFMEAPRQQLPCVRGSPNSGPMLFAPWDDRANHCLRSRNMPSFIIMQKLHAYLRAGRYEEFRDELARAEIFGEIPEFYALNLQAVLAMTEGSEFANEYLEMAEAVASTPYELAVIAESRAAYDLLQGNPLAAAERCLATLEHVHQTGGLWINLLIALYRLGDVDTIDATLRRFTQLNDECTVRLVGLLSAEPALRDVRARPAFQQLLRCRVAG